jgi:hypothetical protein
MLANVAVDHFIDAASSSALLRDSSAQLHFRAPFPEESATCHQHGAADQELYEV